MIASLVEHIFPVRLQREAKKGKEEFAIVSFPKCGRTWLRLMIGRSIQKEFKLSGADPLELYTLSRLHPEVPVITITHDERPFWKKPEQLCVSKEEYRHKKVILLVRDPRDVIVSSYFEKKNRVHTYSNRQPYSGRLSEFLEEKVGGFDTILRYYNIWAQNQLVPKGFMLVRYEDLQRKPEEELGRVLAFLGLRRIGHDVIAEAVRYSSFENMRKMEKGDVFQSFRLRPGDVCNEESYKTRRGKVGGFSDYLTQDEIEYLNRKMEKALKGLFGYITGD